MRKIIKRYGNSSVIVFTQEDMKAHGWEIGDVIEMPDSFEKEVEDETN